MAAAGKGGQDFIPSAAASASAAVAELMNGSINFFSPTSQARAKRLMDEEDERRGASLDIMGESSQLIAALKAEVI